MTQKRFAEEDRTEEKESQKAFRSRLAPKCLQKLHELTNFSTCNPLVTSASFSLAAECGL